MNHLLAKTKGVNGTFFKLISDRDIFNLPEDLDTSIEYRSDYRLEDDEWFKIESFSEKDYFIDFLERHFISTDYNQIESRHYNMINYLCAYQTDIYYFQKISANQIIHKKYFTLSTEPTLVENMPIIVINEYPDAIYVKCRDILYFKKLNAITNIFKGIDELYREATQQETINFLNNDFISLGNDYSAERVKKANRKRIAIAMNTLNNFTYDDRQSISEYIREYYMDLDFDDNSRRFTISNEGELKKLLYGIEQRYYTTRINNEQLL